MLQVILMVACSFYTQSIKVIIAGKLMQHVDKHVLTANTCNLTLVVHSLIKNRVMLCFILSVQLHLCLAQ